MLDANDYADRVGDLPPAERCLIPQHWNAPTSLEDAIAAAMGGKRLAVQVVANSGRWIAECPDCGGAQLAAPNDPRFMCVECANAAVGGLWRPVVWPKDHAAIGELLDQRTRDLANWLPGETEKDIADENALLAGAHRLDVDNPDGNPFHPDWQGHTHTWPRVPDHAGMLTCEECGLVLPAETFEQEGA